MADSQASGGGGQSRSRSRSESNPTPDPTQQQWLESKGKRPRRGEWWSTEMARPVEIGKGFVPDTQEGGGDEFIFFPDSSDDEANKKDLSGSRRDLFDNDASGVGDGNISEARWRAQEYMQRLRRLFPPIPSLVEMYGDRVSHSGFKPSMHAKLICREGNFKHSVDDDELLDEELQPSSNTWSGSMVRSMTTYGPPVVAAAAAEGTSSCGPPYPATGPPSPSCAGVFRSRKATPGGTDPAAGTSPGASGGTSSSPSGGLFRSKAIVGDFDEQESEG